MQQSNRGKILTGYNNIKSVDKKIHRICMMVI